MARPFCDMNNIGKQTSLRGAKPYDPNNSFVKKVATKVTDFIPQKSWISKWFNTSQDDRDVSRDNENLAEVEPEEDVQQPPPSKRPRIRMDVTHPPGTFFIQPRIKAPLRKADLSKEQYSIHNDTTDDFLQPASAGPSGMNNLISSTPATQTDVRNINCQRSELNSLVSTRSNGTTNGMDNNSESSESTSGCSSLIPQTNRQEAPSNTTYNSPYSNRKRFNDDKLNFSNHLQSPRSLFLDNTPRDSLSSRRPSFNASVMTNTEERNTTLLSSPFYNGNTTFGGANAAGFYKQNRTLFNNSTEYQLKVPRRTSVQVKPPHASGVDSSGMSQTAKKILEALEHFSSPISDAKRIPMRSTNNMSASKKRTREEAESSPVRVGLRHLARELTVPTVPDMLKLKRRQKLQDTTVAARKIVSAHSGPPCAPQEYHLRSEADENSKYKGKVKAKSKTSLDEEDTVEKVNLPSIPLPISSLPSFNFTLPRNPPAVDKTITSDETMFKFASPIKVTDTAKNIKSVNNFTFSYPIDANDKQPLDDSNELSKTLSIESSTSTISCVSPSKPNFMWTASSTAPRLKEKAKGKDSAPLCAAAVNEFKSGSIMDALSNKSKKSAVDARTTESAVKSDSNMNTIDKKTTKSGFDSNNGKSNALPSIAWECNECLIKNNGSEVQCFACKAPKSESRAKVSETISATTNVSATKPVESDCFGSQFKLQNNQWECESCLVRNKVTDVKCASCSAPKETKKPQNESTLPSIKATTSDLMEKFKPAEGSWECPGCMLRNSATVATCPCCNASKPGSAKVSLKRNQNTVAGSNTSCRQELIATSTTSSDENDAAQHANSNLVQKLKASTDSWECPSCMVRNADSAVTCPCCNTSKPGSGKDKKECTQPLLCNTFGDKFKKPEGAWVCDSCMLQNDAKNIECVACTAAKPGTKKVEVPQEKSATCSLFHFGMPSGTSNFQFGIDKADHQLTSTTASANGFKFGETQKSSNTEQFTFGIPNNDNKTTSKTNDTTSVTPNTVDNSKANITVATNAKNNERTSVENKIDETGKKVTPVSFSFSAPKSVETVSEKQTDSKVSTAPPFSFGVQKTEPTPPAANKEAQQISFDSTTVNVCKSDIANPSATLVSAESTGTPAPTLTNRSNASDIKPTHTFSFGVPSASVPASNSVSTTKANVCLPASGSTQPPFAFSETKAISGTGTVPAFGQTQASNSAVALPGTFSFSGNKPAEDVAGTQAKKPVEVSTGAPATGMFPSVSSATSMFGNNEAKATLAFGMTENKSAVFNIGGTKPTFGLSENKSPSFGNAESKPSMFATPEPKVPVFGSTEKPVSAFNAPSQSSSTVPAPAFATPASTPSLFGSSATPVFGNTPSTFGSGSAPNLFGTTKPSETVTANASLFTFGSSSTQGAQQQGSGFNFPANSNPTESNQKPLFSFGGSSNATQPNNLFGGSNTFNASAPVNSTATFTFNAPKPSENLTFGQPTGSAPPLFGATQTNQSASVTPSFSSAPSSNVGFNFGPAAPATTAGFNFGNMAPSVPSGGFNFNAPTAPPPVPFDPNTPPSFNFTGGSAPPAFSAPPQVPRKIKKAVRRMR